jgi:hypothetical protein
VKIKSQKKQRLIAVADCNTAIVTTESVAVTMMATLAPLIPMPLNGGLADAA